jgi:hypothetical protein
MANYEDMMKQAQEAAAKMGIQMPGAGAPAGAGPNMEETAALQARAMKLNQSGVEMPAKLDSLQPTGRVDFGGGKEIAFGVTVSPPGGQPYAAVFTQYMIDSVMTGLAPGAAIKVRVDPDDPNSMLFWGMG